MSSTTTSARPRRCNAAPSGPGAPAHWRCAKAPGHKSELHQTATGGGWGPETFALPEAARTLMTTAEVAAAFRINERTVSKWVRSGVFGEGAAFRTLGSHWRFRTDRIREMVAAGGRPAEGGAVVLTVAQVSAELRVDAKTIAQWDRDGRFGEGTVFRTPGGHRRFYADKIRAMTAGDLS